ncbi:phosphotransferase [Streptomyces sp. SAJ15]|uniref:phosphotransferase n=1 Tax=Streptomyces sp. SAJ15 TaxID=2011095 RepID=UPI001186C6C0|nr:phosphotransferase [Streptomyces sp. SAJ15]TVL88999.1 hypothetical protein CD790_29535 [Streptomyces sp. SAJ15]
MQIVTSPGAASRAAPVGPAVVDVLAYGREQIRRAAAEEWSGTEVVLTSHVPSVTGYVHRLRVGGRELYGKCSFLGVSLVSLLRGTCGDWPQVLRAQAEYVACPDCLLAREAAQLRFLARLDRPAVCGVAAFRNGVLFTEPVSGSTLADLMVSSPGNVAELLAMSLEQLRGLHQPYAVRRLSRDSDIAERDIAATFDRKFHGQGGRKSGCWEDLPPTLRQAVTRLDRMRPAVLPATCPTLVYGDLKPEHVVVADSGRPVFLDPGLMRARASVDTAKLVSRTVLLLAASRPGGRAARQATEGLGAFVESRLGLLPRQERAEWLCELLTLWLMDTGNILTTYLAAPSVLPLPVRAAALVRRADAVCAFLDAAAADLTGQPSPRRAWERVLAHAEEVAS